MGRARPCLIRIVAACPRLRLIRVCASHNKTFPGREAFILIQPGRRDPCSQDWPGYAASERPFLMSLAGASGRRSVLSGGTPGPVPPGRRVRPTVRSCPAGHPVPSRLSGGTPGPVPRVRPGGRLPAEAISPDPPSPPGPPSPRPCPSSKRTAGPRTGKRTVGPRTVQSGGQRCDPVAPPPPLSPELQRVQGGRGRPAQTNALLWKSLATVLPIGGCRRGRPLTPRQN